MATTLALAEQNHGEELKRVCLEFVSRHLQQVMGSEGYQHMVTSCPQLQASPFSPLSSPRDSQKHCCRGAWRSVSVAEHLPKCCPIPLLSSATTADQFQWGSGPVASRVLLVPCLLGQVIYAEHVNTRPDFYAFS